MTVYPIQANFSRGELSPRLHARIDIDYYKAGLKTCTNWTALRQGGLRKRPGFKMVKEIRNSAKKVRLIPFVFSVLQSYALEFGEGYVRPLANGGIITKNGGTPSAITNDNPAIVTHVGHGLTTGRCYVTGLGGMTQLNNTEVDITVVTPDQYTINVNTIGYDAYTGGGLVKQIVEFYTPYLEADLPLLDYAQSADVLTVCHPNYRPIEITRSSDTVWTVTNPTFKDGPYLDEPANVSNGITPSSRNVISAGATFPVGSSNAFDGDETTVAQFGTALPWYIQVNPVAPYVCNNYYVQQGGKRSAQRAITAWVLQGWDGTKWVVLHRVADNGSWGAGEKRFFDFVNYTPFVYYLIVVSAVVGGDNNFSTNPSDPEQCQVAEIGLGFNGDAASTPTMTLTFDNTDGINNGAGFDSGDVGRHIRLYASDGKWRWFAISGVSSNKVVTGKMHGYALPDTDKIFRWKLGSWRNAGPDPVTSPASWPGKVTFYQSRRVFARSTSEVNVVNFTKTADFYDFGTSQPLVDDDGIRLKLLSSQVNAITWLAEGEKLVIGTGANIRSLGKANTNQGFGATNFDQRQNTSSGAKETKPIPVGSVLLFADYYGKILREFVYDLNQDSFIAPDVSILSEHLLATGIVGMAYQAVPDSIVWIVTSGGDLVALTYEREQKIVALTRIAVAPGDPGTSAYVESVCSIPGSGRDEVWIIVRRTIGGVTKRYIETLAPEFEYLGVEDGIFLDSSLSYSGDPISQISGLNHLPGLEVYALADGQVVRGLTVSADGKVTLPNAASTIHIGLPYTATLTTLALNEAGQQDGTGLSRRKLLNDARISVMDALGLKAKGIGSGEAFDVFQREHDDPIGAQMNLRTGTYPLNFDMSWRDDGQFTLFSDDPLPCTIRGIILSATGEP